MFIFEEIFDPPMIHVMGLLIFDVIFLVQKFQNLIEFQNMMVVEWEFLP